MDLGVSLGRITEFSNCTIGTDTVLAQGDDVEQLYNISGLKAQIANLELVPYWNKSMKGDRWNSFSTTGEILVGYNAYGKRHKSILSLNYSYLKFPFKIDNIAGRFISHSDGILFLNADQGKLIVETKIIEDLGKTYLTHLILLDEKISLLFGIKTYLADIRCPKLIPNSLRTLKMTISGCRLFYSGYSSIREADIKDLKFEETRSHGGSAWRVDVSIGHCIHDMYSWHQASNLLVIVVLQYSPWSYHVYLVNSRKLVYNKIGVSTQKYFFPSFANGIPIFCTFTHSLN